MWKEGAFIVWWHAGTIWPFFGILWFLLIAFIIFGLVRWMFWGRRYGGWYGGCGRGSWGGYGHPAAHAEAVLRERLAKGEIDEAEYERLLGILRR